MTTLPSVTSAIRPGFASSLYHDEICSQFPKKISCPNNYFILIHEEYLVTTGNGCSHSKNECRQPTDLVLNECSGKQECNVFFPETQIVGCPAKYADLLDYEYQCIPSSPVLPQTKVYTCDDISVQDSSNGFVTSPKYPLYQVGINNCELKITPPVDYGVKLYLIDLALSSSE